MPSRHPSRRDVLKTSAALASVGVLGSLAGCSGGLGGSDGGGSDGPSGPDAVPAKATSIFQVDVGQLQSDEDLKRILGAGMDGETASVDDALGQFQNESGIDPAKISTVVVFADASGSMSGFGSATSGDSYGGMIAWTDLTADEIVSAAESEGDASYSESTYNGTTIYTNDANGQVMATLGGGTFAAGNEAAVKDVIDLRAGEGDALGGTLRSSFTATQEGPIRFAMAVPDTESDGSESVPTGFGGATQSMSHISGSILYANGDNRGMQLNFTFENSETASQMKQAADAFLQQYKLQAQQQEGSDQFVATLERISVSQDGTTVSLSYEDTVDNIVAAIEASGSAGLGGMATGTGGMSTGATGGMDTTAGTR